LIVNIFGTKWHVRVVTILARYCSVMFAHVFGDERVYLQQDGAPRHYHRHVRAYLDDTLPMMDRSKRCYWAPTMVSWPNTFRLLPMGNLEEWSLSTKASHTRNHRSVMCSHHTRHTDSRSSLSSSAAWMLFSRWWWSLGTHIMTHSLSA
jgi:hypothetical protein